MKYGRRERLNFECVRAERRLSSDRAGCVCREAVERVIDDDLQGGLGEVSRALGVAICLKLIQFDLH